MPSPNDKASSRAPEFHGFVAWTSTALIFVLYILWALLPDDVIVRLGVRWYPNRYGLFQFFIDHVFDPF